MIIIQKSIFIAAPIEKVYDFLSDPLNLLEVWPSMQRIWDVQPMANGGRRYRWAYKMAGLRFEGESEDVIRIPYRHLLTKGTGGIPTTTKWDYAVERGGTRLHLRVDYQIPAPLLGRLAEPFLLRLNEREIDSLLINLKERMET